MTKASIKRSGPGKKAAGRNPSGARAAGGKAGSGPVTEDLAEQKRAEEALREAELRYRTLADSGQALIWTATPDKKCDYFNLPWLRFTGRTLEQELGDGWAEGVHPDDLKRCIKLYTEAFDRRERFSIDYRLRRHDGEYRWIQDDGTPRYDSRGKFLGYIGHCLDITDRKRAEEKTRELLAAVQSEKRILTTLIDSISDEIWFADAQGRFSLANPAALKEFALDPDRPIDVETLAKSLEVFRPDGSPRPVDEAPPLRALAGEEVRNQEEMVRTPIHSEIRHRQVSAAPVRDPSGRIIGAVSVVRDITELKKAAENMRSLSLRQEAILAAVPDIIMEVDVEKVYTWANRAGLEFFGEDVLGKEAADYFIGEQETYAVVKPLFSGREDVFYVESWQRRRDGEKRLLAWWCHVLKDVGGNVIGALSTARDITERNRAELLERAVYEIARAADEAESLDPLYQSVHRIIKGLMPAANFLIALYDEKERLVTFPYFVDEIDSVPPSRKPGKGLTDYVLRTGETLLCDADLEKELSRRGEVGRIGTLSSCWLGVPLRVKDKTIGVIAVDNYSDPKAYGEREKKILEYVSGQVANAIERKRVEEALRESEEQIKASLENAPDGVYLSDLAGTFLYGNRRTEEIIGYPREEIIGKNMMVLNLLAPEGRAKAAELLQANFRGQSTGPDELTLTRKDGTPIVVEINTSVVRRLGKPIVIGFVRDVTERAQTEERLRESERKYRELYDFLPIPVYEMDLEANITVANRAIYKAFKGTEDDFKKGFNAWKLLSPDEIKRSATNIQRLLKGEDVPGTEYNLTRLDGSTFPAIVVSSAIFDRGRPVGLRGAIIDISERKRAEEAVQTSLREKEILLREIHHRVKNNMQVISSLFNLQAGHVTAENARGMLKEGQMRIRSMALVHEKLYQSRDLSKIDFADYLRSLSTHLFHFFRVEAGRIRLETHLEPIHLNVNSAVPCGLLVNELVSNSLKHAFPADRKGTVEIGLRRREDGIVELRLADDGVGLPESLDFRRTESLGLQIVTLLVDQLEGTIELERGRGTVFTIVFRDTGREAKT
jgi:PAS domain S-box-containing protein